MTYKALFLDTETTGICNMRTPYNEDTLENEWPYITQLAMKLVTVSESGITPISESNFFIKPHYPEHRYQPGALGVSGLTMEFLEENGKDIAIALAEFVRNLKEADFVVSHNTTFDMKMIKAELLRLNVDQHLRIKPWLDTVYYGGEFIKIKDSVRGRVFPHLADLYIRLYNQQPPEGLHDAMVDTRICADCFHVLMNNGTIPLSRIQQRITQHVSSEQ